MANTHVQAISTHGTAATFSRLSSPRGTIIIRGFPENSSGGPRPANKLLHTYPPPYIFFHLPSSTLICFHHFSTFLSVHLIRFFIIIFPKCSPSFSPFSSPHSFHQLPSKMSFPQSPRLIHFKKRNFAKYVAKIFVIKKIFELSKNDLSISRTKNRTATTSLPSFVSSRLSDIFLGVVSLVGFYLQYIKRYTYIIIITYNGINVIIIVWF